MRPNPGLLHSSISDIFSLVSYWQMCLEPTRKNETSGTIHKARITTNSYFIKLSKNDRENAIYWISFASNNTTADHQQIHPNPLIFYYLRAKNSANAFRRNWFLVSIATEELKKSPNTDRRELLQRVSRSRRQPVWSNYGKHISVLSGNIQLGKMV